MGSIDIANLPAGTKLGPYILAGKLGSGGMGTVYLAEQTNLGRKVALKMLRAERLAKTGGVEEFLNEAKRTAALQHNNLITIHDFGKSDALGAAYYSMEYIHGVNLFTLVQQQGPLQASVARDYILQIASGLGHAHKAGIIHRDLKPENVILDQFNMPRVADLGLAMDRTSGPKSLHARALSIVGTPGWSSPEQMRNPYTVSTSADIFALGCLYYYFLTGRVPFTGETLIDLAVNVCTKDPELLGSLGEPEQSILSHLLAKDPANRPQNGQEALELIHNPVEVLEADAGVSAPEPTEESSAQRSGRRRVRRRRR